MVHTILYQDSSKSLDETSCMMINRTQNCHHARLRELLIPVAGFSSRGCGAQNGYQALPPCRRLYLLELMIHVLINHARSCVLEREAAPTDEDALSASSALRAMAAARSRSCASWMARRTDLGTRTPSGPAGP